MLPGRRGWTNGAILRWPLTMSMSTVLVAKVRGMPPLKKVCIRKRRAEGICSTASSMVRVSKISGMVGSNQRTNRERGRRATLTLASV
ncbi:hypothetical protein D3C84_1158560 [compost metagenome]